MTAYKLYTRDASAWTPGTDTLGAIDRSGTALTVSQHDETHKYLYTKIVNLKFSDIDEDIDAIPAAKDILVYDGADWANVPTSGDLDIATTGAVTISKIGGKTVTLGGNFITSGAYNLQFDLGASVTITLPIIDATLLTTKLADGTIWIGDGTGVVSPRTLTGDVTVSNTGVTAIGASKVTNGMLAGSIAWTKLATGAASVVAVTSGAGVLTTSAITTTQLEYLGVTPGTLSNSKALVVSAGGAINALTITAADINGGSIDNVTIGTNSACTQLVVDNIDVNLNTISTTSGNLNLTPVAGSAVVIDGAVNIDAGVVTGLASLTAPAALPITSTGVMTLGGSSVDINVGAVPQLILSASTMTLQTAYVIDMNNAQLTIHDVGNAAVGLLLANSSGLIGFFGTIPVLQQTAAGASGAAGTGAGDVIAGSTTWTGGVGVTAYTIGDIVASMKNYGLLNS